MGCMLLSLFGSSSSRGKCPTLERTVANSVLAALNGLIAILAFIQLLRLQLYTLPLRWTRQKVFHCLIGVAATGFCVYFLLNVFAPCDGWYCWNHVCGFIALAFPQILFLATFLLLLSFWVDLCHQATDKEEEEEEEDEETNSDYVSSASEEHAKNANGSTHIDKQRRCCSWRSKRIHARQKFVIGVVAFIFLVTIAFALLIWIGMGENPIDSATVAEVYSDLFAIVIFLSGGGLAGYGLALYTRMSRLRVGKTSADLQKVAGLAVVSVICFSVRALFVLLGDIDGFTNQNRYEAAAFFSYSFIGEVIPCSVVLWVMRDNRSRSNTIQFQRSESSIFGYQQALAQEQALLQQWMVPEDLEALPIVSSRSRRVKSGRPDSEGGSTSNSG